MKQHRLARLITTAAAALALAVLAAPPALGQGEAAIKQVMKKALANERERGFCARTGWPVERSLADTGRFYSTAVPGTAKAFRDTYGGRAPVCGYVRVENVYQDRGRKCIRARMWSCTVGRTCQHRLYQGCWRDSRGTGPFEWERQ